MENLYNLVTYRAQRREREAYCRHAARAAGYTFSATESYVKSAIERWDKEHEIFPMLCKLPVDLIILYLLIKFIVTLVGIVLTLFV